MVQTMVVIVTGQENIKNQRRQRRGTQI